jgi:TonB family protein
MGLLEFLRQWQRGRLTAATVVSVLLHAALLAVLLGGRLPATRYDVKRGEPLIVELPKADDSPPPGLAGAPVPAPAARAAPPAARTVAPAPPSPPPAPRAVAKPARPAEPARSAPRPEPDRRVASAPTPKAPEAPAPVVPAPAAPEAAPAERAPERPVAERTPADTSPPERQVASLPKPAAPAAPGAPNILTALRRGPGGAGGSGQGRAGIEGEPIPLDSANPKYVDYLDQVRRRIKEKWGYPCEKNEVTRVCEYRSTQLILEFGIAKNGELRFVTLRRTSGHQIYDDYALNAVKLASPFPPIPDSFSMTGVPIHATFSYVLQSSLTNILR